MISDIRARLASIEERFGHRPAPPPAVEPTGATPVAGVAGATTAFQQLLASQQHQVGMTGTLGQMWQSAFTGTQDIPIQRYAPSGSLPDRAAQFRPAFETAGARYGIDPDLLAAVAWTESGFNPEARSHAGAIGLMQIMPGTAEGLGVDPRDPIQAIDGAARYLRRQLDRFGDVRLALAAYNAGPGAVQQYGGIPPYEETANYVVKVLGRLDQLRSTP